MERFLTPSNILFVLGLLGVLFSIYHYFKDPQIKSDKTDALLEQRIKFERESSEKRFSELQMNFQSLLLQNNNHIHTLDTKVDSVMVDLGALSKEVVKLSTIINERIPKR